MQDKPVSPRQLYEARTRAKGDFRYRTAPSIKQRYRRPPDSLPAAFMVGPPLERRRSGPWRAACAPLSGNRATAAVSACHPSRPAGRRCRPAPVPAIWPAPAQFCPDLNPRGSEYRGCFPADSGRCLDRPGRATEAADPQWQDHAERRQERYPACYPSATTGEADSSNRLK
jgi:hypothetical protein